MANIKVAIQNNETQIEDEIVGPISVDNYDQWEILTIVYNYYQDNSSHLSFAPYDYTDCKRWFKTALTYNEGEFNPLNKQIVAAEKGFDFQIDADWAHYKYKIEENTLEGNLALKGTIDQINQINDNTLEILDWKTGARKNWATGKEKTFDTLMEDPQLRLYHYAVCKLYPEYDNILVTIFYLKDGGPFTLPFSKSQLGDTEEIIRKRFEKIKETNIAPRIYPDWKCTKFCHAGKESFEDTEIAPLIQKQTNQITPIGQKMCKCDQVYYTLQHRNKESVIKHMSNPKHTIGQYDAPGELN